VQGVRVRRRFFVDQFSGNTAAMTGDAAHHLGRVLRAEAGQLYELSDGRSAWLARIEDVGRDRVEFSLIEPIASREAAFQSTLLLSIVKFDSFEWALEKATELGVHMIVPLAAARSEKALLHAAEKTFWALDENSSGSVTAIETRCDSGPEINGKARRGVFVCRWI